MDRTNPFPLDLVTLRDRLRACIRAARAIEHAYRQRDQA